MKYKIYLLALILFPPALVYCVWRYAREYFRPYQKIEMRRV